MRRRDEERGRKDGVMGRTVDMRKWVRKKNTQENVLILLIPPRSGGIKKKGKVLGSRQVGYLGLCSAENVRREQDRA